MKARKKTKNRNFLAIAIAIVVIAAIIAGIVWGGMYNHRYGYIPVVNPERYDRSLVESFINIRPNTIFVFEDTNPAQNAQVFFEHIDKDAGVAQRITRTPEDGDTVELIIFGTNSKQNLFMGNVSRGNHMETEQQNLLNELRGPLAVRRSWRVHNDIGPHIPDASFVVTNLRARVTVPFGTFHAVQVRVVGLVPGHPHDRLTRYYAPGVGLIKQVDEVYDRYGVLHRFELVLVDIIENTGLQERFDVYFPNEHGRMTRIATYTTIYTNDVFIDRVFAAANEYWEQHFGFRVEHEWLNDIGLIRNIGTDENSPRVNFNEQFLEAMNAVADTETEEQILLSIAATLASVFERAPVFMPGVTYNPGYVYVFVNGALYSSDRISLDGALDVRIDDTPPTLRPSLF